MKRRNYLILTVMISFAVICISCFDDLEEKPGVYDVILRPDSYSGKDALIMFHPFNDSIKNLNIEDHSSLIAAAWATNDTLVVTRSLIEFNTSWIKPDGELLLAELSLYFNPTDDTFSGHSTISGSNAFWIEKAIKYWAEDTVSWNNRPETTSVNAVYFEASTEPNQSYINVDVTDLVRDVIATPHESFGFEIRLETEQFYRAVVFASSDHIKSELHPKLRVVVKQ